MHFTKARIRNFKALEDATIPIGEHLTTIVGANGSGKSSILQAIHWFVQSTKSVDLNSQPLKNWDTNGWNEGYDPKKHNAQNASKQRELEQGTGSVLVEENSSYMPTPSYLFTTHSGILRNSAAKGDPYAGRIDLALEALENEVPTSSLFWIRSARNSGISVHASNNPITRVIRSRDRLCSSYVPGLAGIAAREQRLSPRVIERQAAAGDANSVLRNLLHSLEPDDLKALSSHVSQVIGQDFELKVTFSENTDFEIKAEFQTGSMKGNDKKLWRPLEIAGIGFLQIVQIFTYLLLYKPRLLLIDEPDSHIHPDRHEPLLREIAKTARDLKVQVVITTHSPNIMRGLPNDATVVWMRDGQPQGNPEVARRSMGWGILDKKIVLVVEDNRTEMLKLLLSQWPSLERVTAVWPVGGKNKFPIVEVLKALQEMLGDGVQIVAHRDRDFMSKLEVKAWKENYKEGLHSWVTDGADIEAYFSTSDYIAKTLEIEQKDAHQLINNTVKNLKSHKEDFYKTRKDILNDKLIYSGTDPKPGDDDIYNELSKQGQHFVVKKLCGKIIDYAQSNGHGLCTKNIGRSIPGDLEISPDLRILLQGII